MPSRAISWSGRLRDNIVRAGIRAVCGSSAQVGVNAADDVPLVSAGLRFVGLRLLGLLGKRSFVAKSGLGYDFVCHIGDAAEYPFYYRRAFELELALCAAWLRQEPQPVAYDVGANVGFFATHLAQMLAAQNARIVAFEPIPPTFTKLLEAVRRLGLSDRVQPVAAAVSDGPGAVRLNYSDRASPYAQLAVKDAHPRVGTSVAFAAAVSLDAFHEACGVTPSLIKIDVEGAEPAVLRGATRLMTGAARPALMIECNPTTLAEFGSSRAELEMLLPDYAFYYVDDIEGQRRPFGDPVRSLGELDWICNVFAVPHGDGASARWRTALAAARQMVAPRG